jgi:hypothetical protein
MRIWGILNVDVRFWGQRTLRELVTRFRGLVTQEERARALERELADVSQLEGITAHSPRMLEIFDLIPGQFRCSPHLRGGFEVGSPVQRRQPVRSPDGLC